MGANNTYTSKSLEFTVFLFLPTSLLSEVSERCYLLASFAHRSVFPLFQIIIQGPFLSHSDAFFITLSILL